MSDRINCPNGHLLGLARGLGGAKVKCPLCQVVFDVPASPDPKHVEAIVALEAVTQPPSAPLASLAPPQPPLAYGDRVHCPNGHLIGIAAGLEGSKVMCPLCQVIFQVPLSATPVEIQDVSASSEVRPAPLDLAPSLVQGVSETGRICPAATPVDLEGIVSAESRLHVPAPPPLPAQGTTGTASDSYLDDRGGAPRTRDDEADIAYFRRKKKRAVRHALMRSVDTGLGCYSWKCVVCAFVLMLPYIAAWLALAGSALHTGHPEDSRVLDIILAVVFILGAAGFLTVLILGIVGAIFILRVPPVVGARALVTANLGLEAFAALLYVLLQVWDLVAMLRGYRSGSSVGPILGLTVWFCVIGQAVLLLYFLRKMAAYQKHAATIADLKDLLDMTVGLILGALGILVLAAILVRPAPILALIIVVIVALVAWGAFGRLLFRIAAIITRIRGRL